MHLHQPDVRFTKIPVACPVITLGPSNIGNGVIGVSYNETLTQSGGAGPVTFTITGGALPPGLNLSSAGIVSGFPTAAGSFSFTVTATDSNGCAGSRTYSMRVTAVACSKSALSFSVRRPAASMASFADDPLVPGVTIKAVHITELHARIDAIRIRLALPPFGLINAMVVAGDTVRAQHIQQLRTAIVEAYQAACLTPPVFTDSIITGGQTPIRAVHVTELRSAVVALELTLPAQ